MEQRKPITIKYPRRKHQTDHDALHVMFKKDSKRYQSVAKAMHWATANDIIKQ